ncbi:hypothetical protein [Blastococcus sp. SYSU D00820]
MLTLALAWLAVLGACTGAVLFGQTARTGPARRPSVRRRLGLVVSMSGPWLVLIGGLAVAAVSGAWLVSATATLAALVAVAVAGFVLAPR